MVALCVLRVCLSVPAMCLNPESGRSKMYIGYMLWLNHFIYRCRTSFRWVCPAENSRCSNMFQTLWIGPASEKHWRALYVLEELSGWTCWTVELVRNLPWSTLKRFEGQISLKFTAQSIVSIVSNELWILAQRESSSDPKPSAENGPVLSKQRFATKKTWSCKESVTWCQMSKYV